LGEVTARGASSRLEDRISWPQVRLIFVANWRTWLARWTNKPWMLVLNVMLVMMFVSAFAGGSVFLGWFVAHLRADPAHGGAGNPVAAAAAVHSTFLAVLVLLVVTPVLGFRGNEFLDVTKLFALPVGHRTVFAATLCCLMASLSVAIFLMPIVAVSVGYGWSGPPGSIVTCLVAGLLLVVFGVALGQFVLLFFLNTLKSRKWRDLSTILMTLIGGSGVAAQALMRRQVMNRGSVAHGLEWFSSWKDWTMPLPSWWAANAATETGVLRFLPLLAIVALVAWLVRASAVLQERAFFGEVEQEPTVEAASGRGPIGRLAASMKDPLGALVEKDLSLLRREPVVRSLLINGAMYPIMWLVIGAYSFRAGDPHRFAKYAPLAGMLAYPLLLMEMGLVMNLLGIEGGGAVHALLLPVPRRVLLLGKDVAFLLAFGTLNAAFVVVITAVGWVVTKNGPFVGCLPWCLLGAVESYCAVAMGLAIGNLLSIVSPIRLAVKDRRAIRQQMTGRDGCTRSLFGVLSVFGLLALSAPIAAAFHLPYAWQFIPNADPAPGWLVFVTAPLGVVVSLSAMWLGAHLGGMLLSSREEDIAARLTKSEE
jgi:hypothetical protein